MVARNQSKRRKGYKERVLEMHRKGTVKPGEVSIIDVRHDSWCSIWRTGTCNCSPDIEVREVQP